jgi:hypothetical protein
MSTLRDRLAVGPALLLLALPFLVSVDPAENALVVDPRPPALALLVLALLALASLAGRGLGRGARIAAACVLLAAAGLQWASALVLHVLDRPLDLYFDVAHLPSLAGLFADAVGPMRAAAAAALAVAALSGAVMLIAWALGVVERALAPRSYARVVGILAALALLLPHAAVSFAAPHAVADQAVRLYRAAAVMGGYDHRYDAALAAPQPAASDLDALRDRDVFLVYVESYGTIVLDDPAYRAALAPALDEFAAQTRAAGYGIVSARLTSPVFGAGSWLAHGTLASGLKLDPFLYRLLTDSSRLSLPRYLRAAGHRTVAVMPGIKKPWPEGDFFGFERSYYAADLGYGGPPFGWFAIPDQYTLARLDQAELGPGHKPLFAEIVLVSSHTPFAPVPPYVADWGDAGPYKSIAQAEWQQIYQEPDWAHLDRPYRESIAYDLKTLAGWLARLDGKGLVIVLGDHQPPVVSGASSPWTVPVHVLSRDPALLAPFEHAGYVAGAFPPADGLVKGMETFLGDFLADFSGKGHAGS